MRTLADRSNGFEDLHGERLRDAARAWFRANWDPAAPAGEWLRRMHDAHWAYPTWPVAYGGRGLGVAEARIVREERRRAGVLAPPSGIGPTLLAPMLFVHGNDDQQARFLRGLAVENLVCCQMLSEPDAGSDLAASRVRAERDGDEWVITGSKIWTSNAELCDVGMLLARTNPDVPKHRGLTFFLLPIDQPGVEIRPLRQMTGDARFNQVFFDGARVHDRDRLGAVEDGWAVTRTFLAHEKNSYNPNSHEGGPFGRIPLDRPAGEVLAREGTRVSSSAQGRGIGPLVTELAARFGRTGDPLVRQELARLHTLRHGMTATTARLRATSGRRPGWEGPVSKLTVSKLSVAQRELGLAVQGPAAMLADADATSERFTYFALHSPSLSIAGGTDEIQRNALGEQVLGLPAEPRADRDVAFRDLPS